MRNLSIKSFENYNTHCEIHPSLMLSAVALNIPFPEHSQYPRNAFSCGQSKQAVSLFHTNYKYRMDKTFLLLHYGQVPFIKSKY